MKDILILKPFLWKLATRHYAKNLEHVFLIRCEIIHNIWGHLWKLAVCNDLKVFIQGKLTNVGEGFTNRSTPSVFTIGFPIKILITYDQN